MNILVYLRKAMRVARDDGFRGLFISSAQRLSEFRRNGDYRRWAAEYDTITADDRSAIERAIAGLRLTPVISILMPVYNVDEPLLRRTLDSVTGQVYPHWQLCIADDASTQPHIRAVLSEYEAFDPRIRVVYREVNGHISAASNSALELVTGDFTALMDHDDEMPPHALYMVAKEIAAHPETEVIYSDEDKIDISGSRFQPSFKPDWNPELMLSLNLVTHMIVYRTSLMRAVGGFRVGFEGSQDYDLALRITANVRTDNVRHIPKILYHWRAIKGSVALSADQKPYAHERARTAITETLAAKGVTAVVTRGRGELHRLTYPPPKVAPLISVILFGGRDNEKAREIVANAGPDYPTEVIACSGEPRFAALSSAVNNAAGSMLCFLDARTLAASAEWLGCLAGHAARAGIGAVGAKVLYPNKRLKHPGYVLGIHGGVGRPYHSYRNGFPGHYSWLVTARNVSAVSADCLVIRRDVFDMVGGFDAASFPANYGDIDLCLRLIESGYRNVWTPWAEIVQPRDRVSDDTAELDRLIKRHRTLFQRDPYYNPNLSLDSDTFALAFPPRVEKF